MNSWQLFMTHVFGISETAANVIGALLVTAFMIFSIIAVVGSMFAALINGAEAIAEYDKIMDKKIRGDNS